MNMAIVALLLFFLALGVFARFYNRQTRVLMSIAIIAGIIYMYIAKVK